MSLVNDMLRDLDKRRKESSSGAGSVSLTPAPELPPESGQRPVIPYLIAALLVGAGVIAWFWFQQDSGGTRELNIAPQLAIESAIIEETQPEEIAEENAARELAQNIADVPAAASLNGVSAERPEPQPPTNVSLEDPVVTIESASNEVSQGSIEENLENAVDSPIQQVSDPVAEQSGAESAVARSTVNLQQPPVESVKNASALSLEEKDVLAVQQALRLISENRSVEAYTALEQQILENRYAHQTRETYAKLLFSEGNYLGALELTEAGLGLSPNHSGFKKVKARILISQGKLAEAINLLITRAPPMDVDLEYHELLATAQLASRDYRGALISYTGLVRQDQNQGKWWYGFAASQDSLGNIEAARQGYSKAVSLSNLSASLRRRSQERLAVLSQ